MTLGQFREMCNKTLVADCRIWFNLMFLAKFQYRTISGDLRNFFDSTQMPGVGLVSIFLESFGQCINKI